MPYDIKYSYEYLKTLCELICEKACPGLCLKFGTISYSRGWRMSIWWKNTYVDAYSTLSDPCASMASFCGLGKYINEPWLNRFSPSSNFMHAIHDHKVNDEIIASIDFNMLNVIHRISKECTSIEELTLRFAIERGE